MKAVVVVLTLALYAKADLTCVSKSDIDMETGWSRSECTGLSRLDPQTCECVDTCPSGVYGDTYQKVTDTYIQSESPYTQKVVETVKNGDRYRDCSLKCTALTTFNCTAFYVLPFEGDDYNCFMFETTVALSVTWRHADVWVRDCQYV